jgi:type VI secretion system secreted protein Hcp
MQEERMSQRQYRKYIRRAIGVLALSLVLSNYALAFDMFLKVDGIKGESTDAKHKDEIDVLAWSWGATQTGSAALGGGGGAGVANFQDINITKYMDISSPLLLKNLATGAHIASVNFVIRNSPTSPEFYKLKLDDCIVSSISMGGSGGQDKLTENISLNFAKYMVTYYPQNPDGTLGTAITTGFDLKANRVAKLITPGTIHKNNITLADAEQTSLPMLAWSGIK